MNASFSCRSNLEGQSLRRHTQNDWRKESKKRAGLVPVWEEPLSRTAMAGSGQGSAMVKLVGRVALTSGMWSGPLQ